MFLKAAFALILTLQVLSSSCYSRRIHYNPRLEAFLHALEEQRQRDFLATQQENMDTRDSGSIWVVLVAGSNMYYNYRHQADICHAYQIVKSHGVPESNIITMMYNDIAFSRENPRQGVIINKPGGPDVYGGVVIDYEGKDVTPKMFLNVLTGDETLKAAGKKVLGSGPNDHVFVFFSDHGAPGLIAFPNGMLYANDLSKGLHEMYEKNMYRQMTLYVEACESGSMFSGSLLPPSLRIYALTAANAVESSYACYYDAQLGTYLGDLFSVTWMEDTDANDIQRETLQVQYLRTKALTNLSHVMQFGDLSITSEFVGAFQGNENPAVKAVNFGKLIREKQAVPQEDVEMRILLNRHRNANSLEEQEKHAKALKEHIEVREKTTALFERILTILHGGSNRVVTTLKKRRDDAINFECYKPVLEFFSRICMPLNANSPALNHLYKLANLCQLGSSPERIIQALVKACK
jgi:legumain